MINVKAIPFIEFASPEVGYYDDLFKKMGFKKMLLGKNAKRASGEVFRQNNITFIIYTKEFSEQFYQKHGPSVPSFSFLVDDPQEALKKAVKLGCTDVSPRSYLPAIEGVGGSRIFLEKETFSSPNKGVGLKYIDHLTNNVYSENLDKWTTFYKEIFGFRLLKYFDIDGKQTGLVSNAMGNDNIAVPINIDKSDKGQIAEYLKEYNGEGVQHIALLTNNIYNSVKKLRKNGIEFLDVPDTYYEALDERIPGHGENVKRMKENKILIDGKKGSILLQIFTKTVIGPVFFEIIQRKNNKLFGDGNFQALFESIELDQMRRGVL